MMQQQLKHVVKLLLMAGKEGGRDACMHLQAVCES
jgi:hypothetical protein